MTFPVPTRACSEQLAAAKRRDKRAAGAARSIASCIAMSGHQGGRGRGHCDKYKYLGRCDKLGTTCTFRHEVVARYAIDGHRAI